MEDTCLLARIIQSSFDTSEALDDPSLAVMKQITAKGGERAVEKDCPVCHGGECVAAKSTA